MKLRIVIGWLVVFVWGMKLSAQQLYFSNIPRLNSKAYYNKVIGENPGGIYVLRYRDADFRSGFAIERYSHKLDFVESESYLLGKKDKLQKVFTTDSGLFMIKGTTDKNRMLLTAIQLGFQTAKQGVPMIVYQTENPEKIYDNTVIEYSPNRRYCAMWVEEVGPDGNQQFTCIGLKTTGEVLYIRKFTTDFPYRDVSSQQSSVSDSGDAAMVFMLTRAEKRSTETAAEEHFLLTANHQQGVGPATLGDYKFFLSGYELAYNQYSHEFCLAGYYDFKKPNSAHGIFDLHFHPDDSAFKGTFIPLERKFVNQLIGAKEEDDDNDPDNYFVRRIVPRSDGGYLIVGEYFQITQQMETFYLNGVPQVSSKNMYNYNDIMLVSINKNRETEWSHVINKRQNSLASLSYLHSIGIYVCEKNVNLIYNDNSNQNNRVIHIKLSRNGVVEQKILLNSENEYTAVIPIEGKQTGYNRFVAPLIQSRQISLIQLVDTD